MSGACAAGSNPPSPLLLPQLAGARPLRGLRACGLPQSRARAPRRAKTVARQRSPRAARGRGRPALTATTRASACDGCATTSTAGSRAHGSRDARERGRASRPLRTSAHGNRRQRVSAKSGREPGQEAWRHGAVVVEDVRDARRADALGLARRGSSPGARSAGASQPNRTSKTSQPPARARLGGRPRARRRSRAPASWGTPSADALVFEHDATDDATERACTRRRAHLLALRREADGGRHRAGEVRSVKLPV
jgi:hypothetical protein